MGITTGQSWTYRLKPVNENNATAWSRFLIMPSPGYIETETGPVSIRDVEYIDINPVEYRHIGRLIPPKLYDHTAAIQGYLDAFAILYTCTDEHIRIRMQDIIN